MEFNKSNRFNDNNESQSKQTLIHYKGELGEFDYDPNIWKIENSHLMFKNKEVNSLPENLELPKGCTNTPYMFCNCKSLTDISSLKNWDISKLGSIADMFYNCTSLKDISPLQNWNTSKVKEMYNMFEWCENLTDISPLQNWDISSVTTMKNMFEGCINLKDKSLLEKWNI